MTTREKPLVKRGDTMKKISKFETEHVVQLDTGRAIYLDFFEVGEKVAVMLADEAEQLHALASQAEKAEKQREATRAELVRVSASAQNRRRLPAERSGMTHTFVIHSGTERFKGFITVGLYDDGTVGEVFMKLDQQGSQISGFCDAWAIAVSMLLQTGTPLSVICQKFKHMKFEPSGRTETPGIRTAESPIDYAARYLERRFVNKLPLEDGEGSP